MAGSQDPNENPVAINVVPMVDVIFCLCVFFMCSFKFKELEGKFESWLPKDKGQTQPIPESMELVEIRVKLEWDTNRNVTVTEFGNRIVNNNDELKALITETHGLAVRNNKPDTPVIIDAGTRVPWREIVNVMNLSKHVGIDKIEFAAGKDYEAAQK